MKRTLALALCLTAAMTFSTMQMHAAKKSKSPITIGCIVSGTGDVDATFRNLQEMGFTSCQIGFPQDYTQETIDKLKTALPQAIEWLQKEGYAFKVFD